MIYRSLFRLAGLLTVFVCLCGGFHASLSAQLAAGDSPDSGEDYEVRWWKGNIHTHTLWSDGNDFPEMVADWYRAHGYNFLALSDHNVLSKGTRWFPAREIERRGGKDAVAKYRARFGDDWVVTRGMPGTPTHEVLLKPLAEFRALVEARDRFIMIPGEEISDSVNRKPVHMNATNLVDAIAPLGGQTVAEAIANNLRTVEEQAERAGRDVLVHLNHPNFGMAVTAEDLASVIPERFFEVYNGHPAVGHLGDANHPGVERIWDIANTIRVHRLHAPPLFGVGVDDSHKYHGRAGSHPGRGWIMVRSRYLTPASLIQAMKRGDFYASSGVTLDDVRFNADTRVLSLRIAADPETSFTTEFIGSVEAAEGAEPEVGVVLDTQTGTNPSYQFTGNELFVRAVVTSSRPHPDPSFTDQHEQAWTQPIVAEAIATE